MPCDDTSARIMVWLSDQETLCGYDFTKISCSRTIGGDVGYREAVMDKHIDEILTISFDDAMDLVPPANEEDQFFLYLEWDALRTAIHQYLGSDDEIDHSRYKVLSIGYDEKGVEIIQVTAPPESFPKNIPCCHSIEKRSMAS